MSEVTGNKFRGGSILFPERISAWMWQTCPTAYIGFRCSRS